jgi:D-sedoheptulose 7-phosphate isomerase
METLAKAGPRVAASGGVVGPPGGHTARLADVWVRIPISNPATSTPHTESFQALVWRLLVSHPKLKLSQMKWEGLGLE